MTREHEWLLPLPLSTIDLPRQSRRASPRQALNKVQQEPSVVQVATPWVVAARL